MRAAPSADDAPAAVAVRTGFPSARFLALAGGDPEIELAAMRAALLEAANRGEPIGGLAVHALPRDALLVARELERVPDARVIGLVHVAPDLGADGGPGDRADDDRDLAVLALADLRADGASHHAAQHGAHRLAIATAFEHAVIALPLLAGVAGVILAFLALAVSRCPRRRIGAGVPGGRDCENARGHHQRGERSRKARSNAHFSSCR